MYTSCTFRCHWKRGPDNITTARRYRDGGFHIRLSTRSYRGRMSTTSRSVGIIFAELKSYVLGSANMHLPGVPKTNMVCSFLTLFQVIFFNKNLGLPNLFVKLSK